MTCAFARTTKMSFEQKLQKIPEELFQIIAAMHYELAVFAPKMKALCCDIQEMRNKSGYFADIRVINFDAFATKLMGDFEDYSVRYYSFFWRRFVTIVSKAQGGAYLLLAHSAGEPGSSHAAYLQAAHTFLVSSQDYRFLSPTTLDEVENHICEEPNDCMYTLSKHESRFFTRAFMTPEVARGLREG